MEVIKEVKSRESHLDDLYQKLASFAEYCQPHDDTWIPGSLLYYLSIFDVDFDFDSVSFSAFDFDFEAFLFAFSNVL